MELMSKYEKGSARWLFDQIGICLPREFDYVDNFDKSNPQNKKASYDRANDKTFNRHAGGCVVIDEGFYHSTSPNMNFSGVVYLPEIEGINLEDL